MFHLVRNDLNVDFMGVRYYTLALSGLLVVAACLAIGFRGVNFGIDFTGGVVVEVHYPQSVQLRNVRNTLNQAGYHEYVVQYFGSTQDVSIRLPPSHDKKASEIGGEVMGALKKQAPKAKKLRVEFVGPEVGSALATKGALALLLTLVGILAYVYFRYERRMAVGSVIALFHDIPITIGIFALFQIKFDLTVLAALMAVMGYSINDTVVVFDRIRENFPKMRRASPYEVLNRSISQTMSRTIITSLTVFFVAIVLYAIGGPAIHGFALVLIIGVIIGTYSSIFIASALALEMGLKREHLQPPKSEDLEKRVQRTIARDHRHQ